jgi:hypothetical protein
MVRQFEILISIDTETIQGAEMIFKARMKDVQVPNKIISIKQKQETRTELQNNSLHLWLTQLSDEFNEKDIDMRLLIREDIKIPASMMFLKEYVWKPVQKALFGKKSTTQLFKTKEIDQIVDIINRAVVERFKGQVNVPPFPSWENKSIDEIK